MWKHSQVTSHRGKQSTSTPVSVTKVTTSDKSIGDNVGKPDHSFVDKDVKMCSVETPANNTSVEFYTIKNNFHVTQKLHPGCIYTRVVKISVQR